MLTKGDKVYAACVDDGGTVVVEEASIAAVGHKAIRLESGGRAFRWRRMFPIGLGGYSEARASALEELRRSVETDLLLADVELQRTRQRYAAVCSALEHERRGP